MAVCEKDDLLGRLWWICDDLCIRPPALCVAPEISWAGSTDSTPEGVQLTFFCTI